MDVTVTNDDSSCVIREGDNKLVFLLVPMVRAPAAVMAADGYSSSGRIVKAGR